MTDRDVLAVCDAPREGRSLMRVLVLGLGNEIIADDAIGVLAVRRFREDWCQAHEGETAGDSVGHVAVDAVETSVSGVALLEYFMGHDRAVVIDAVMTGKAPPGSIIELRPEDLGGVVAPSPHYAGLPELTALARELEIEFPLEVKILAVEVQDPHTIGGAMTPAVRDALPDVVDRVRTQVEAWLRGKSTVDSPRSTAKKEE